MNIKVINNGVEDEIANISVAITRCHSRREDARIEFLAVLRALKETNSNAFMDALEAFFKTELEQYDDEE